MVVVMPQPVATPKMPALTKDADHERLLALINSMSDGVLMVDESGSVVMTNSVALDMLDVNNINGRQLSEVARVIDKDGHKVDLEAMVLKSEKPRVNSDWRLSYSDNSAINLYLSVSPVRYGFGKGSGRGWVVLIRDISREKSLEEERDEFISVASHELRTPVAVAEGNISNAVLLSEQDRLSDSIRQMLTTAHDQIIFLGNLINDLAMLSRADRGLLDSTHEEFDAGKLIDSLAHDYGPQAIRKGLQLKSIPPAADVKLTSSQLYVREILQNFVTNAIKYTEKGNITLSVSKVLDGAIFEVSDTGIGISKSEQNNLFGKFFRSSDYRVKKVSGTGLGLYVSSKLARLLSGKIEIDSQLNRGTIARLTVPNLKFKTKSAR